MRKLRNLTSSVKPRWGCDIWIAKRLVYLGREHERLAGDVPDDYLTRAQAFYLSFLATGDPSHRFAAWQAIAAASSLLARRGKGARS